MTTASLPSIELPSETLTPAQRASQAKGLLKTHGDALHQQYLQIDMSFKMGSFAIKHFRERGAIAPVGDQRATKAKCLEEMGKARMKFTNVTEYAERFFAFREQCERQLGVVYEFQGADLTLDKINDRMATEQTVYTKVKGYYPGLTYPKSL